MKRNRKRKKLNNIMIISVCAVLLLMTAGYAAMQTNLGINAKGNVVKKGMSSEEFIDSIPKVTEGDGLYVDSYEENVYTYRGSNPNNYVTFNGETWRIISANTSDNTIKIMRNARLESKQYDSTNERYDGQYCNDSSYGCNIWGSSSTLYDSNMSPITELARQVGSSKYALPSAEADLNEYLNTTYYNSTLNETARSMVKTDAVYKAGLLKYQSGQTTSTDVSQVNAVKWKGKVALIDATEYVRASTNSNCTGAYSGYSSSRNYCSPNNWMYLNNLWWTMSPFSGIMDNSRDVWYVASSSGFWNNTAFNPLSVRPVLTLSSNVQITGGDGTENNPFTLSL